MSELRIVFEFDREEQPYTLATAQEAWGSPEDAAEQIVFLHRLAHERALAEALRANPSQWRAFWLSLLRGWLSTQETRDVMDLLQTSSSTLDLETVAGGLSAETRAYFAETRKLDERFPGVLLYWLFTVQLRRIQVVDESGTLLSSDESPKRPGRKRKAGKQPASTYPLRLTLYFEQHAPLPTLAMLNRQLGSPQDEAEGQRRTVELSHERALHAAVHANPDLRRQLWVKEAVYFLDGLAMRPLAEMFGNYWPDVDLTPVLPHLPVETQQYLREEELLAPNHSEGALVECSSRLLLRRLVFGDEQGEVHAGNLAAPMSTPGP